MSDRKKRLFTQKELEKHINARLIRERKKYTEPPVLLKMLEESVKSGEFDADACAEVFAGLEKILSESDTGNRTESGNVDVTAESFEEKEDGKLQNRSVQVLEKETAEEQEDVNTECAICNNGCFEESSDDNHGESETAVSMEKESSEKSTATESGNAELIGRLSGLLSEFAQLLGKTENVREQSDGDGELFARRAAASTGFCASSASDAASSVYELTPAQREIARQAGISYREYAGLLRDIPTKIKKRRQF